MDSWTLQGDSYSFLRSAPRTFSLHHRDGTPNHVEIFDITSIPTHRSAISETTCLCDIFGDDCESPSLSSSPASGSFVPSQRGVDGRSAASPLVDDLNDSSGSYHTAQGSSEGEEGFEDSRERLHSPTLQRENSERRQSEGQGLSSGHPGVSKDISPKLEPKSKLPIPQLSTASPSAEVVNPSLSDRTPSPGYNSPHTLSPEGRVSSLSSSSVDTRSSLSSPNLRQTHLAAESRSITPKSRNSSSHQSSTHSPSPEPESTGAQLSSESRNTTHNHNSSPSPEPFVSFSPDLTSSALEPRLILSSHSPSLSSTELSSQSRETLSPELKYRSYTPETQVSSPFPELRGRVSLPDLLSRGSTPDIEDSSCTSELVSYRSSAGRDTTRAPENQYSYQLSAEPGSTVSTPAPRYTPPSPVISLVPTPELRESSVSPEVRCAAPSPLLLSTACSSSCSSKTWTRAPSPVPSPEITQISPPSESRPQASSPIVSYNLAPSPEIRNNYSPIDHRHTAASPEIRIIASSPEVRRREKSSEVELTSNSLDPHLDSTSSHPRSLTSSPHITGICYSVVQPEDRDTTPLPDLSRLSTPEPGRTHPSPEPRSPTPSRDSIQSSIAESTSTPRGSPHITGFTCTVLQPENTETTLSPQPRYQTPSPEPKFHTPSPEPGYQTPSPQTRNRNPSPVAPSSEPCHLCHQQSPVAPSPEVDLQYTQPSLPLRDTPEVEGVSSSPDIAGIQYPTHLAKDKVSASSEIDSTAKSLVADIKNSLPVVKSTIHSPESTTLPFSAEERVLDSSLQQQTTHREITISLAEQKQDIVSVVFQKEDPYNNSSIELQTNLPVSLKNRSPNNSPAHKATSNSPVQRVEAPQPKSTAYSPASDNRESISSLKSTCTPECSRGHPSPKVGSETRERFTEDMAHHVRRKRTPSPPLTRFTPVHIIAPEKPYRQWQHRGYSPSQVVTPSLTGKLKKPVTNTESPNVAPNDSNSRAYWVRLERELEMEKEMQLEEEREREREIDRERQWEREMERERKREERVPDQREGWQRDASYRGEQVELSFSARNRKGPASRRTAPTSRETRQGMPTARSYSESLLATRQLQQQQTLFRAQTSQQDTRGGGPTRRLQPTVPQNKNTAPGRVATSRPSQSSSSSMGSELDEADNEVKWFTDLAFHSLSNPEVDYLDMYNSSHRSSTNISQPSTQESPAGANAAWLAYAEFRGSAPRLDNEDFSYQQSSTYYSDDLDTSKRYEMGSFECVDVAVEREESRKGKKGVPKRQIQLKRKNTAEGKQDESSENSSPVVPVMVDSPSLQRHSKETLVRQHSTPAAMQESYHREPSPKPDEKNERKSKLQKSASLDETCTKTKMATCLIKSVLSKKMQSVDKQTEEHVTEEATPPPEDKTLPPESAEAPLKESPRTGTHNLSASLHSDHSLSSEDLAVRREPSTKDQFRRQKNLGVKSSSSPTPNSSNTRFTSSLTDSERIDSQSRNTTSTRSEMRSELMVSLDSKQSSTENVIPRTGGKQADGSKSWEEREGSDSANATTGNTRAPFATGASSTQARMTNRDQECEIVGTEDHKQLQQSNKSTHTSKTPEMTLKTSPAMEKKKTSLNVSLTPEVENKPELRCQAPSPEMSFREKEERVDARDDDKIKEEEGNGNNKVKVPIHKVRDVRRLVKNTYNLSFKAASAASLENEEKTDNSNKERREEIKEERKEEIREEKREVRQEVRREERREEMAEERQEEKREERREELQVERKEERREEVRDAKLLTSLQSNGKPLSRPQPMQIECKAVCWKEDKNKTTPSKIDPDKPEDEHQVSPQHTNETDRESESSSYANTQSYTTRDAVTAKPCQPDTNMEAEAQDTETETYKMPDSEDKPVVVRRDKKPPMLGSLPKLPSKDREVSTAVVVIRDGPSKTKTSASPAQEEILTPLQAPSTSSSPRPTSVTTPGSSGHSVSMLLKEKGYQADIGAVVGEGQSAAGGKGVPRKHVNRLEIPLQTSTPSDGGLTESQRERTFSSSSIMSGPTAVPDNTENLIKNRENEGVSIKPTVRDAAKQNSVSPLRNAQQQTLTQTKQKEQGDFEAVKRQDPTFPPRSPALRRFRPQPIEVKSLSKETQKQDMSTNNVPSNRPQAIEVRSIANNSQKPVVPPKPNYKFKPTDLGPMSTETQKSVETTSSAKPQGEEKPQTIVVSSPTIYRKLSNETTSTSNYTRKLAVSAVSSYKPPPSKTAATTISSLSNQSTAPSEIEASNDRAQQQQPRASPQSSRYTQRPTTLATASIPAKGPCLTSAPGPIPDLTASHVPGSASAVSSQASQAAFRELNSQPQYPRTAYPQERAMPVTSNNTKQPAAVSITQAPGYTHTHQPYHRSLSNERSQRTDDLRFYASDDPPSYDERESFSPLMLPDLTSRRPNRYQPSSRPPPCSCTSGCPSHPGLTPPHHHHSPRNLTPPAPPHSPGQVLPYPVAQPPLRPHQCRPDPQPMSYQPSSPKSSPLGPSQPVMYQPLHQPPACPPHPSLMQSCPADRPLQPLQHIDPRRPPVHRSPQQQPPGVGGGPYNEPGHSHSPSLPPMDPQYLCGPQSLGPSYGSEYGGDSSSLYSESSYGQTPRRVLMDPETGKYFYIEVPVQPLRKMLFDPETGQYVEVLIPQQAMSHSGLYPPSAVPYPSLHNPNMYAPAPQYLPYAAPPPPTHPQAHPQPPRHPEASSSATMHQNGPGVSYGSPSGQGSKPEPQNHPPLDQSYLEGMYYVPTGMNASPNSTPPDCYHKHPPNLPTTGGKRS